jgi:hypothetical protein
LEKKMKKTFAALTLATIMMLGTTLSFAGIIISDAAAPTPCAEPTLNKDGIIIFSLNDGIIIFSIAVTPTSVCVDKDGIIISD